MEKLLTHVICTLMLLKVEGVAVPITYVQSAVLKGVGSLDGSPPTYHFHTGSGAGINNWIVHIEGSLTLLRCQGKRALNNSEFGQKISKVWLQFVLSFGIEVEHRLSLPL